MRKPVLGTVALVLTLLLVHGIAACGAPAAPGRAARGSVSLPEGDVARGRAAFERSGCVACHEVEGEAFPAPTTDIPTGVKLGSAWEREWTAQEIATAILDPSHQISDAYVGGVVQSGELSRMGPNTNITVGELLDLVAFLRQVNVDALAERER